MQSVSLVRERSIGLFQIPGCHFSEVSLDIEPGMKFEHWERLMRVLERAEQGIQWYIGDALNYGEREYGDKYAQVLDAHKQTGIPVETLRTYQWVAEKVKPVTRVTNVSWSVHREVATLPDEEQARILAGAEAERKPRRVVEKEVGRVRRALGIDKSDEEIIHDPATTDWLNNLRQLLADQEPMVPPSAIFLRGMIHGMMGVIDGQLERTVEGDCYMVREAVKEILGTDDEIYQHLQKQFYFISDPQLDDTLQLLIEQKRIKKKQAEGRKAGQKGKMVDVYLPLKNDIDNDEDFAAEAL